MIRIKLIKDFVDIMKALGSSQLRWPSSSHKLHMAIPQVLQHSAFSENSLFSQIGRYENAHSSFVLGNSIVVMCFLFLFTLLISSCYISLCSLAIKPQFREN